MGSGHIRNTCAKCDKTFLAPYQTHCDECGGNLQQRIEKLEKALRAFANKNNWDYSTLCDGYTGVIYNRISWLRKSDPQEIAREALQKETGK